MFPCTLSASLRTLTRTRSDLLSNLSLQLRGLNIHAFHVWIQSPGGPIKFKSVSLILSFFFVRTMFLRSDLRWVCIAGDCPPSATCTFTSSKRAVTPAKRVPRQQQQPSASPQPAAVPVRMRTLMSIRNVRQARSEARTPWRLRHWSRIKGHAICVSLAEVNPTYVLYACFILPQL